MLTPAYGLTATERVLPSFVLDWTTGLVQAPVDVTRTGVATFVGSNGLIQSAAENTQRVDYSTGVAGLLVEESRQNVFPSSTVFTPANNWNTGNASVAASSVTALDGVGLYTKLITDNSLSGGQVFHGFNFLQNTAYTFSLYAKKAEWSFIKLQVRGPDNLELGAWFNLDSGTVGTVEAGVTAKIEPNIDGGYRCFVTRTFGTGATTGRQRIYASNADNSLSTGDGVSGVLIWGAQLEAGAFPTSYIPTEASAVTRNADVATVTGTNFNDFYNATEGALLVEAQTVDPGSFMRVLSLNNGTTAEEIYLSKNVGVARSFVVSGGVTQASFTFDSWEGAKKLCLSYKQNNFASAFNGGAALTDSLGTVATVTQLSIGARYNGISVLNGHIQKIMYWPQRLTNTENQAFTK